MKDSPSRPLPTLGVRQAIAEISTFLKTSPKAWRAPKLAGISRTLSRRAAMAQSVIPQIDFDRLHQKFLHAAKTNDWSGVDPLDWSDVTHILWTREPNLLGITRFQSSYRRFLEGTKTARPFKGLIHSYFAAYDPQREGVEWAGSLIRKILVQKRYFILNYWRELEMELQIFSTTPGPRLFATRCLDHPDSVFHLHRELGLVEDLAVGGYARHAYLAALQLVQPLDKTSASHPTRLQRLMQWTISDHPRRFLRFPDLQPLIFHTLLPTSLPNKATCELLSHFFTLYAQAWRKGDKSCPDPTEKEITSMGKILTAASKG